ncbi:hypothetical protein BDZ91DRAFT_735041 [Kalaharituber pfeilii]|nr:hypothetical protein BDZ91DRAFT_735041 [Kalaharituber pfeilii]
MGDTAAWIGAVCAVVATVIGVATLLTVYVAATQLYSRHRLLQHGLSKNALGPWKPIVVDDKWHRLRTDIHTPTITVSKLVRDHWEPKIARCPQLQPIVPNRNAHSKWSFSMKGELKEPGESSPLDTEAQLAEASWVNFLCAIGMKPQNNVPVQDRHYALQSETELINGIVPMRWKGRDLVAIASMIGFQATEKEPSFTKPMPLPTQWSGPLGWLQFRSSSDGGCIAEFRLKHVEVLAMVLPKETLDYYMKRPVPCAPKPKHYLPQRLWQSIGGFYLPNGYALFLGGANCGQGPRRPARRTEEVVRDVMDMPNNVSEDDLREYAWGSQRSQWPEQVKHDGDGLSQLLPSDLFDISRLQRERNGRKRTLEVLKECPGLLHTVADGGWAETRGLDWRHKVYEYDRQYKDSGEVREINYPYGMGDLRMDEELLKLIKSALSQLKPDGFYFCPSSHMKKDLNEIFEHITHRIEESKNKYICKCPDNMPKRYGEVGYENRKIIYHATVVVNEMQRLLKVGRTHVSVEDLQIMYIASEELSKILGKALSDGGTDLEWALIYSPKLFQDLMRRLQCQDFSFDELLKMKSAVVLRMDTKTNHGEIDCTQISRPQTSMRPLTDGKHLIPLVASKLRTRTEKDESGVNEDAARPEGGTAHNGEIQLDGATVLAAFLNVVLVYFWVRKSWITDVTRYDTTIPQSVTMV